MVRKYVKVHQASIANARKYYLGNRRDVAGSEGRCSPWEERKGNAKDEEQAAPPEAV
jgi:hypothetical protein